MSQHSGSVSPLSEHPASPALLTSHGPHRHFCSTIGRMAAAPARNLSHSLGPRATHAPPTHARRRARGVGGGAAGLGGTDGDPWHPRRARNFGDRGGRRHSTGRATPERVEPRTATSHTRAPSPPPHTHTATGGRTERHSRGGAWGTTGASRTCALPFRASHSTSLRPHEGVPPPQQGEGWGLLPAPNKQTLSAGQTRSEAWKNRRETASWRGEEACLDLVLFTPIHSSRIG